MMVGSEGSSSMRATGRGWGGTLPKRDCRTVRPVPGSGRRDRAVKGGGRPLLCSPGERSAASCKNETAPPGSRSTWGGAGVCRGTAPWPVVASVPVVVILSSRPLYGFAARAAWSAESPRAPCDARPGRGWHNRTRGRGDAGSPRRAPRPQCPAGFKARRSDRRQSASVRSGTSQRSSRRSITADGTVDGRCRFRLASCSSGISRETIRTRTRYGSEQRSTPGVAGQGRNNYE
jgi:hypothetical protein